MSDPLASRPHVPGYEVAQTPEGMLTWSWARTLLAEAPTWWLASVRPDGRPHVMPIWGAWVDDRGYVLGQRSTRWSRNLEGAPACVVHVQRGEDVAIVEGDAQAVVDPDAAFLDRVGAGFQKYAVSHGNVVDVSRWLDQAFWEIRPRTVFGFSDYLTDATRWRFEQPDPGRPDGA